MASRRFWGIVLWASTTIGCSAVSADEGRHDEAEWHEGPPPLVGVRWPFWYGYEFLEADTPEARHAQTRSQPSDTDAGPVPFVVLVGPEGTVFFEGERFQVSARDPAASLRAQEDLGSYLRPMVDGMRRRGFEPYARMVADRHAPWRSVSASVAVFRELGVPWVEADVERLDRPVLRAVAWDMAPASGEPAELSVVLSRIVQGMGVVIATGDRTFAFPRDGPRDAAYLRNANEAWSDLRRHLPPPASPTAVARIVADPLVPWQHVVKTLDLLVGAGWRHVDLPAAGARWSLRPPAAAEEQPFDHGLPGLWVWIAVGAAAVVGFVWSRWFVRP